MLWDPGAKATSPDQGFPPSVVGSGTVKPLYKDFFRLWDPESL